VDEREARHTRRLFRHPPLRISSLPHLGCGMGKFAALLARERGALLDAVDSSPTQHHRAVA
jgi:trans-aconitate methyltransferase